MTDSAFERRLRNLRPPHRAASESGSAFIELSFVVLTLLIVFVGTVELTFLLLDYNALTKSVRSAASFWTTQALDPTTKALAPPSSTSLGPAYGTQTLANVIASLVRVGNASCPATELQPTVTPTYCRDHDGLSYVMLDVSYPHCFLLWPDRLREVFGASIMLRASAVMRVAGLAGDTRAAPHCVW